MIEELQSSLEMFLGQKIELLQRGESLPTSLVREIPSSWIQALSLHSPLAESIVQIWRPLLQLSNDFGSILAAQVLDVALVRLTVPISTQYLYYIFQRTSVDTEYSFGWLAGLPATEAVFAESEARLGRPLPSSYRLFSTVHNGFLVDGWSSLGIRPVSGLYLLSELEESSNTCSNYDPEKIVAFSGDGAGNEQGYDLTRPLGQLDYWTVDWDHETKEISRPQTFWSYLMRFTAREMGLEVPPVNTYSPRA